MGEIWVRNVDKSPMGSTPSPFKLLRRGEGEREEGGGGSL